MAVHGDGADFIGGDSVLLKIVNGGVFDFDFRDAAIAALHEDAGAALAGVERRCELEVADGYMVELAGSVLERNTDQVRRASGDAVVSAVDGQAGDRNAGSVCNQQRGGDSSGVEQARGVRLHGGRHEDGAVVGIDVERLADFHLLDVDALADVNFVAGRSGVDGVLDAREAGRGTFDFVVIDDHARVVGRERRSRSRPKEGRENSQKQRGTVGELAFHGNVPRFLAIGNEDPSEVAAAGGCTRGQGPDFAITCQNM
jgi:hypothetical protein